MTLTHQLAAMICCAGVGKAGRGPAAVITSSGTAVANLLPAAIEAAEGDVPLILLTADRPPELRDAGANQTIDQVKIFGGFVRYACDVAPPDAGSASGRQLLTTIDAAFHKAVGGPCGPVHLNCNFREPLAPTAAEWPREVLSGLNKWLESDAPFTTYSGGSAGGDCAFGSAPEAALPSGGAAAALSAAVGASKRVLVVAGHMPSARCGLIHSEKEPPISSVAVSISIKPHLSCII